MDALAKIRDVAIAQQTALSEQRARAARGDHMMTDYAGLHDDYKNYTGGDAKKRRGVSSHRYTRIFYRFLTNSLESCTSRSMPQLQSCGDAGMATWSRRGPHPLQRLRPTLRQAHAQDRC